MVVIHVVVDPSALLAVLLHEPERPAILRATDGVSLIAPVSVPWEVGNALVAGVRRRRLTAPTALAAWDSFERIPIRLLEIDGARALDLALSHGLYAYDAYVLDTARAAHLPLLTLDRALGKAARAAGVQLIGVVT